MFINPATAFSVLGAITTFGVAEATYSNSYSGSSVSKSCESGYFWYDRLSCCAKNGGESNTPPSGSSCPDNFYWHTDEKCCVPKSSDTSQQIPSTTSCGSGFWWSPLNICLSIGVGTDSPPSGYSCPATGVGFRASLAASLTSPIPLLLLLRAATAGAGTQESSAAFQARTPQPHPMRPGPMEGNVILLCTSVRASARPTSSLAPS
ncbi:hypothetical protein RHS01_06421 [Rhizoctonia solani]|uniref:CBM1 domain-containing protein n=1 Tax=Rhizoctonia solani TaxID=456999 RepID=A0A8H7M693_9AGAM|nr:hypothetical protein RHS01_06421 [Rhizoctonia solani]